jgi:outer membrane protein W
MLKKLLITLAISVCLLSQGISAGLRAGLNTTKPATIDGVPSALQPEGASSFLAGLALNIDLLLLSLDADILYVSNKFEAGEKSSQLQIPVTAKFSLIPTGVKPYIRGGVAYNHYLSATEANGDDVENFDENLKNGLSLVIGAGVDLSLPIIPTLNIDARYILPLYDTIDFGTLAYKINQFQISVGFGF